MDKNVQIWLWKGQEITELLKCPGWKWLKSSWSPTFHRTEGSHWTIQHPIQLHLENLKRQDSEMPPGLFFKWRLVKKFFLIFDQFCGLPLHPFLLFVVFWIVRTKLETIFQVWSDKHWDDWDDLISTCANNVPRDADQDQFCLCCCSSTLLTYVYLGCVPGHPSKAAPQTHSPILYRALWLCHPRYRLLIGLC